MFKNVNDFEDTKHLNRERYLRSVFSFFDFPRFALNTPWMKLGAIFDWDGVIIDSSAAHEESWDRLAAEEKRTLPEGYFKEGFGRKNAFIIPHLLNWADEADVNEVNRLGDRKEALYREILKERGIQPLLGVRELLAELKAAEIPCVVGSSTPRENIDTVMRLAALHDCFDAVVSADDVTVGKPHPEVFLKAAACIDRVPEYCVVFEDAHVGIEAGLAGGMKVVGVATTHPRDELKGVNFSVECLTEVNVSRLKALWSA